MPKDRSKPLPVILFRTPYNNDEDRFIDLCIFFAQQGYIAVAQDLRGRYDSEGQFYPWVNEYNDGYDTIEWLGSQPWCDGSVGMIGRSYVGNVQWQAATISSSYLKAIVPRVIGDDLYRSPHYQGSASRLG